jgi:hypothetical protein
MLADAEHFGAALWADTPCGSAAILHFDGFGVLHYPLGFAFYAIRFHQNPPKYLRLE